MFFDKCGRSSNFRVIDINYIMNSSEAGKSIIQTLDKINKKNLDELKNIEAKLEKLKKIYYQKKNFR